MLIKFNEEQTMIRDMVREFTKNEVEPRDYYMDQNDAFDRELYASSMSSASAVSSFPKSTAVWVPTMSPAPLSYTSWQRAAQALLWQSRSAMLQQR